MLKLPKIAWPSPFKFRIQRSLITFETGLLQLGQLRLGSKMDQPPRNQKKRKLRKKNMIESKPLEENSHC